MKVTRMQSTPAPTRWPARQATATAATAAIVMRTGTLSTANLRLPKRSAPAVHSHRRGGRRCRAS